MLLLQNQGFVETTLYSEVVVYYNTYYNINLPLKTVKTFTDLYDNELWYKNYYF